MLSAGNKAADSPLRPGTDLKRKTDGREPAVAAGSWLGVAVPCPGAATQAGLVWGAVTYTRDAVRSQGSQASTGRGGCVTKPPWPRSLGTPSDPRGRGGFTAAQAASTAGRTARWQKPGWLAASSSAGLTSTEVFPAMERRVEGKNPARRNRLYRAAWLAVLTGGAEAFLAAGGRPARRCLLATAALPVR